MNANSTLLEVFEKNIHKETKTTASVKEEEIQIKPVQHSFIRDISHQKPELEFEIKYFHLVLLTRDRVVLVGDNLKTFPILAKRMPSKKEIKSFISNFSIQNPRTIIEPKLYSAFLVGETNREGFLKSDIIQYHNVDGINVHPSVWSFFHFYPEYIGNDILYSVQSIVSDNYIIEYLQDRYEVFMLKNDAERFGFEGQPKERRLGQVGFMDVDTTEELDEMIKDFTKEFKVEHICIRIIKDRIIPVWIANLI